MKPFKVDRLAMHQTWYDNNKKLLSLEAHGIMQELLAMCRERTAERDEARREICQIKGTVRWNHFFPHFDPKGYAKNRGWDCHKDYK
jgi:hypothetical protein